MKRSEYEERLEELNRQIEELKNVEIEEDGVLKPKFDDEYWFLDDEGLIYQDICVSAQPDNKRISIGNVFRTEEEAKHEVERRKVLTELKKYSSKFDYGKENYFMFYSNKYSKIMIDCEEYRQRPDIYFKSYEEAEEVIKKVGIERIIKYYLGVEEKNE